MKVVAMEACLRGMAMTRMVVVSLLVFIWLRQRRKMDQGVVCKIAAVN